MHAVEAMVAAASEKEVVAIETTRRLPWFRTWNELQG
jgi:hypothetical protein